MKYNCIEQTIDYQHNDLKIRLWIDITLQECEINKILQILNEIKEVELLKIIDELAISVPHINAIQIISSNGIGVVAYTTYFADDVHG